MCHQLSKGNTTTSYHVLTITRKPYKYICCLLSINIKMYQIERTGVKRTVSNQGHVKFGLFRPRTVIYVENETLFTLKNRFRLSIIIPGKCKYILLNKNVSTCNYFQRTRTVPLGYTLLSTIQRYLKSFAIIFPVICRNRLQSRPDKMTMR